MARLHAMISIILCAFPTVAVGCFFRGGEWLIKKRGVDRPSLVPVGLEGPTLLLVYLSCIALLHSAD